MHEYSAPQEVHPWYHRRILKHRASVEAYNNIGLRLKNSDRIIQFIEENEQYIQNRPNRFQYDDFHVGNIIVKDANYAGTIDFSRYNWGDPIHDFLKVGFFSRAVSVPFSVGQIRGYFENTRIPDHFWNLYACYVVLTVISTVVWTMKVVPDEIDGMLERIHRVLDDHRNFELVKPIWYTE